MIARFEVRADSDQLENKEEATYQMPVLTDTINPDKQIEE